MNPNMRKYAPYGIYLSLIAAVTAAGFFIVQRSLSLSVQVSLGVLIVGLALFIFLDPQGVREFISGRQMQYGSNSLIMSMAFIGILIVINYLGYKNDHRWDLTEGKEHSLVPESIDVLNKLSEPVYAQAFFTKNYPSNTVKNLLESYKIQSKGNFNYEFIDPESDPIRAQKASISRDGTIVFNMGDRQDQVTYASEKEITSSLIKLSNPGERVVYFLTGHGEFSPDGSGDSSYTLVKSALETKNYSVKTLNLLTDHVIPSDIKTLIIAGAQNPLTPEELVSIKDYMETGGTLVVLSEPRPVTQFGDAIDPMAEYLSESWGVELGEDVVIDPNANPPLIAIASNYANHPITEKLMGLVSLFPTARSIRQGNVPNGINQSVLVLTSSNTWAETDINSFTSNSQVSPDEGIDYLGPVSIAISATNNNNGARIVVFGDSEFGSDAYYREYGNGDLIINSIDWAAKQDELINLTPKDTVRRTLVPPQTTTIGFILLVTVFLIPGAVLVSGVVVWVRRKRKG